jgi:hypothetical protein
MSGRCLDDPAGSLSELWGGSPDCFFQICDVTDWFTQDTMTVGLLRENGSYLMLPI